MEEVVVVEIGKYLSGELTIVIPTELFEEIEKIEKPRKAVPICYDEGESASVYPWGGFFHDDGDIEPGPGHSYRTPIYEEGAIAKGVKEEDDYEKKVREIIRKELSLTETERVSLNLIIWLLTNSPSLEDPVRYVLVLDKEFEDSRKFYDSKLVGVTEGGFSYWDSPCETRYEVSYGELMTTEITILGLNQYKRWWEKIIRDKGIC